MSKFGLIATALRARIGDKEAIQELIEVIATPDSKPSDLTIAKGGLAVSGDAGAKGILKWMESQTEGENLIKFLAPLMTRYIDSTSAKLKRDILEKLQALAQAENPKLKKRAKQTLDDIERIESMPKEGPTG